MASNFSSLRSSRKSLLNKLSDAIKQETSKAGADERFWKLTIDQKTGIGYAKLRFLPQPKNEELPWVRVFQHAFKGPKGQWFIENCPTTLGQRPCPICQNNSELWNTGVDANKKIVSDRKRKLNYISNILVIEDPAHPEHNGKVFLFKYGKKIYEKITDLIEPQFPDASPIDPFEMGGGFDDDGNKIQPGCEFKLKSQKKDGFINYDKSEFSDPIELFPGDDQKKESTWEAEYALTPFTHENQFKSFDDLAKRFNSVMTGTGRDGAPATADAAIKAGNKENDEEVVAAAQQEEERESKPAQKPRRTSTPATVKKETPVVSAPAATEVPDDEEELKAFFAGVIGND
jgi:hypothetical protein